MSIAAVAAFLVSWDGMLSYDFTDYQNEVQPALDQLRDGHVAAFLTHLPPYGGSLVLRAPFAVAPKLLWGGGALAMFRVVALPCVMAGVWLGLHLWGVLEARAKRAAAVAVVLVCAANPMSLRAFEFGHPEDVLGAGLCVASIVLALRDRAMLAGLCAGLAAANKAWAVLVVVPSLLALDRRRMRFVLTTVVCAATVMAPIVIVSALDPNSSLTTLHQASLPATGPFFHPWQLWWFLGHHGEAVRGLGEAKLGYRVAPLWVARISHPVVVGAGVAVASAWGFWRREQRTERADALLLFALVMFLRCALDTWDNDYYAVPFVFALASWEALARRRGPWLAGLASLALWVQFDIFHGRVRPDIEAAIYLIFAVGVIASLGAALFAPLRLEAVTRPVGEVLGRRLPTLARIAKGELAGH